MGKSWYRCSVFPTTVLESPSKYNFNIPLYIKTRYGIINSWEYTNKVKSTMACTHSLADIKLSSQQGVKYSVGWADLDPVEHRNLAVGRYGGGISLYDSCKAWTTKQFSHLGTLSSDVQVTCVQWYPFDAGLITSSSSSETTVKIWDPNPLSLVDEFAVSSKVNHHDLSPVASGHSLIAAALNSGEVALCDIRTGSSSHHLRYHSSCSFVQWSKHDQNILASGGINNLICIWDVRSSKACLRSFNEDRLDNSKISSLSYTYDGLWLISLSTSSKSPVVMRNSKTYEKRKVRFRIPFKRPTTTLRIDFTRNYYPDLLYIPAISQVLVYNLSTGALVNTLQCHDTGLHGVNYNPLTGDLYTFGGKKNFMVFSPRFVTSHYGKEEKEPKVSLKRLNEHQLPNNSKRRAERVRIITHEDNWSSSSDEG